MRLQHFTTERNALLIGMGDVGLTRGIHRAGTSDDFARMTMGQAVVWLTKETSNLATPEHIAHLEKLGVNVGQKIGEPLFGGPVGCIVEIERSKYLMRWVELLRTTSIEEFGSNGQRLTGRQVLAEWEERAMPGMILHWWISLRDIPASKIYVPMTREQAIAGAAAHASNSTDAEARDKWQELHDRSAALEPDDLLIFHAGKCQVHGTAKAG